VDDDGRIAVNHRPAPSSDPWSGRSIPVRSIVNTPPNLGASVAVVHLPGPERNGTWRPSLFGRLRVTFTRPRLPRAFEADLLLALPLTDDLSAVDWRRARRLDPAPLRPGAPEGWHRFEKLSEPVVGAVFGWKAFQQAQRDLEAFARERLVWALEDAAPVPAAATEPQRRDELRRRVARALGDLTGAGTPAPDHLAAAAVGWLLGSTNPLSAATGASRVDDAESWRAPPDLGDRAARLAATLAEAARAGAAAPAAPAAERLPAAAVRVDQVGLLWTPTS
jgi:hypothetical protein